MLKKLIVTGAAAGLLLVSASAAFAAFPSFGTSNMAVVTSNVSASSTTGGNSTSATWGSNKVTTGNAYSKAGAVTLANTNVGGGNTSNGAFVLSNVGAGSSTGGNSTVASGFFGGNTVTTGNAHSTAGSLTVVNTNLSFGK